MARHSRNTALRRTPAGPGGLLNTASRLPSVRRAKHPADLGPLVAWHRSLADPPPHDTAPFAALISEAGPVCVLARNAPPHRGCPLGRCHRRACRRLPADAPRRPLVRSPRCRPYGRRHRHTVRSSRRSAGVGELPEQAQRPCTAGPRRCRCTCTCTDVTTWSSCSGH